MKPSREYLLEYLQDEFSRHPDVRVRILPYLKDEGVSVRTETREYLFEFAWVESDEFQKVREQVTRIKDLLGDFTA